ncbi:MAG: hypothetical protein CVT67_02815 [Actinobacteria bacterium HGW-Actinobacteria-7]|jgi:hypothetical protein|nr:MAG: hypothetical protein CVT67_02815 [Actinobacteria bacterium HGW-Actinobacteria-7]
MPQVYAHLDDHALLNRLADMSPTNAKAAMAYQALCDDDWFAAVAELRRRFRSRATEKALTVEETSYTPTGRLRLATSIEIDALRWRAYWNRQRMTLVSVSRMIDRCDAWASIVATKRRAGMAALEEIAVAMEISLADLIEAVGTDGERERSGLLK